MTLLSFLRCTIQGQKKGGQCQRHDPIYTSLSPYFLDPFPGCARKSLSGSMANSSRKFEEKVTLWWKFLFIFPVPCAIFEQYLINAPTHEPDARCQLSISPACQAWPFLNSCKEMGRLGRWITSIWLVSGGLNCSKGEPTPLEFTFMVVRAISTNTRISHSMPFLHLLDATNPCIHN